MSVEIVIVCDWCGRSSIGYGSELKAGTHALLSGFKSFGKNHKCPECMEEDGDDSD